MEGIYIAVVLPIMCVIMTKRGPGDANCSENCHKSIFEYFGWCEACRTCFVQKKRALNFSPEYRDSKKIPFLQCVGMLVLFTVLAYEPIL